MFRKPVVWVTFLVIAAACAAYTAIEFPRAFPLVTLDLKMDRQAALDSARRLADEHGWGPQGYRQAASFDLECHRAVDGRMHAHHDSRTGSDRDWA